MTQDLKDIVDRLSEELADADRLNGVLVRKLEDIRELAEAEEREQCEGHVAVLALKSLVKQILAVIERHTMYEQRVKERINEQNG